MKGLRIIQVLTGHLKEGVVSGELLVYQWELDKQRRRFLFSEDGGVDL